MKTLVIDADSMVYAASACAESNHYAAVRVPPGMEAGSYELAAAEVTYDAARKVLGDVLVYKRTEVKPEAIAIAAVRTMVKDVYERVRAKVGKCKVVILLNGYGNFRERMASVIRYKYNRVETKKPAHFGAVRKHLVDDLGAELVHWYETDDRCAIMQTADRANVIVSSIDKDLLQVPGLHFIPQKGFLEVSEYSGILRFYMQALAGDSTDGVPGCYRIGPKSAKAILGLAAEGATGYSDLEKRCWAAVVDTYTRSVAKHPDKCGYADPLAAAIETARLVYLLRKEPEHPHAPPLWEPPTGASVSAGSDFAGVELDQ